VPGGVGVDPERLFGVGGPVFQHFGAKLHGSPVVDLEGIQVRDLQVQVQLLRDRAFGPGRTGKGIHLLEGDAGRSGTVTDDQPFAGLGVGLAGGGRFVTLPVGVAEQLTIKLCEPACIGGIQDHLSKNWERTVVFRCHPGSLPTDRASGPEGALFKCWRWDDETQKVEDPFEEPGAEPDKDVWAHASGWDERDFAQRAQAGSGGPIAETGFEPIPAPLSPGKRSGAPHPLHVVGGVGGVAVVLAMIVKLLFIASLVNEMLSMAHEGVWTYMCAYGVVGVFVGCAMRWTSWMFGLGQVLRPELYEAVGSWLVGLGVAIAAIGYLGYLVTHYVF
jgi:hypothetical protein